MNEPKRHHFLPVFYLKNWCNEESGKLVEFSTPFMNEIKPRRVHPKGTGYIDKLYAVEGISGELSYAVEKNFLSPVDNKAATACQALLSGGPVHPQYRRAWAHFIMTLLLRAPREINIIKDILRNLESETASGLMNFVIRHAPKEFHSDAGQAFEELKKSAESRSIEHIIEIMSNEDIVEKIVGMDWDVIDLSTSTHELLTSDRPVMIERGEQTGGETAVFLPLSPKKLFIAVTNRSLLRQLKSQNAKNISQAVNTEIIENADKLAYGSSDRQITFVKNRFGKRRRPSIIEENLHKALKMTEYLGTYLSTIDDNSMREKFLLAAKTYKDKKEGKKHEFRS